MKWVNTDTGEGIIHLVHTSLTYIRHIRSISPYSVRMRENTDQKKLPIWTHFTRTCAYQGVRNVSFLENLAYILIV